MLTTFAPTSRLGKEAVRPSASLMQRRCVCGRHTVAGGECADCRKHKHHLRSATLPRRDAVARPAPPAVAKAPASLPPKPVVAAPAHQAAAPPPPTVQSAAAPHAAQVQVHAPPRATSVVPVPAGAAIAPDAPKAAPASHPRGTGRLAAVVANVHGAAAHLKTHAAPSAKSAEAHAAAGSPPAELQGQAQAAQVGKMDQQQPKPFSREAFKAALLAKIQATQPKTLKDARDFKESGKAAQIKKDVAGVVAQGKEASGGDIAGATKAPPDMSRAKPKPTTPLPPADPGPPPVDVHPEQAAPTAMPAADVSLAAGPAKIKQAETNSRITDSQLSKSNEPSFNAALTARKKVEANAAAAPPAFRKEETSVIGQTQAAARLAAGQHLAAMHGTRGKQFSQVLAHQSEAQARDEKARAKVGADIQQQYDLARAAVEAGLKKLDDDVNAAFDKGATAAQQAFEDYVDREVMLFKLERYATNPLAWAYDLLMGAPPEINQIYNQGRDAYLRQMDHVIDDVSAIVENGLLAAKAEIAKGKAAVDKYVAGLEPSLRECGQAAAKEIGGKFDSLEQSVNEKQNQLVDSLSTKYAQSLEKIDAKIADMKAADKGLVDQAMEFVDGVIETIKKMKAMLLGMLARAGNAVDLILDDPIGFLGHLVAGVKLGFTNFIAKIGTYLQKGLLDWLLGALSGAGITLPETFDLKGIFSLVMQVLGLTYANIRARAVDIVGEKIIAGLEQAAGIFKILITQGPLGIWEFIKEKIGDLKTMVIDQIKSFVMEKIIMAGVTWVIGLLNPASAFIKACKAIYDIIMFFVERGSQIIALVNAVIDSVTAIAKGAIGVAANLVEGALAKAVPVVIGFLASLLGLDGISEKIKKIIETIRKPINAAIDWVIHQAVKLVKAVAGLFAGGKKQEKTPDANDPEHDAKVAKGLAELDQLETQYVKDDAIARGDADKVAAETKAKNPVFKSVTVVQGKETWDYQYVASPANSHRGVKRAPVSVEIGAIKVQDPKDAKTIAEVRAVGTKAMPPGKAYEAAISQLVVNKIILPQWESELGIPISVVTPWRGMGSESDVKQAVLKYQQTHASAKDPRRAPDATMEVRGAGGELKEVRIIEITLVEDFTGTGKFEVHKAGQFFGTMSVLRDKYPADVPIKFIFLAPRTLNPDTKTKVLEETVNKLGMKNVQIAWKEVVT